MAIIKAGFTPGFRGRQQAPTWNRRTHYLGSEHGRDAARLLGAEGKELENQEAIQTLGGPRGEYHEVIVAPSAQECAAIKARNPEHPQQAMADTGTRIAQAHAQGRPYVLAIHEQDGRFHYHIAVSGPMPERTLGKHGHMQKTWDRELHGDEPRIQDWQAHRRFQKEKAHLQELIRQQRENETQRREAMKRAVPGQKLAAARPFEVKARDLIERRYATEFKAIHARYEARGALGSPRHQAELEQAEHRRTGSLRRLEKREADRHLGQVKARLGRGVDQGGRMAQSLTRGASRLGRSAADQAMRAMGLPAPVRMVARAALALADAGAQTALRASQETAKAALRSSLHVAQASVKTGAALVMALPTGGASLAGLGKEVGQDLGLAGKELGQGALRAGGELAKGAARTAGAGVSELLPRELRMAQQALGTTAKTTLGAAKDTVTLSPLALGKTLANGALELGGSVTRAAGLKSTLPEPLQKAFQVAGWLPVAGVAAKALELASTVAHNAINAATRGLEVDR
ncbi:MAG: hypothetical protein H6Q00_440 [Holophagaceae bacterium]|nr:hypothetical protein [Holophagaceae bacterium]